MNELSDGGFLFYIEHSRDIWRDNMKCQKCNTENKDTYTKCRKCGRPLVQQKPQESVIDAPLSYNWLPAAIMIAVFIAAILIVKLVLKY